MKETKISEYFQVMEKKAAKVEQRQQSVKKKQNIYMRVLKRKLNSSNERNVADGKFSDVHVQDLVETNPVKIKILRNESEKKNDSPREVNSAAEDFESQLKEKVFLVSKFIFLHEFHNLFLIFHSQNKIIENLNDELKVLQSKYNKMKKNNHQMLSHLVKHQAKICHLEGMRTKDKSKNEAADFSFEFPDVENEEVEDNFSAVDLIELNSIPKFKSKDREFVGKALQIIYKENFENLLSKKKIKMISPKKKEQLTYLLLKRFNTIEDNTEKMQRMNESYINRIISYGLYHERTSNTKN